MCVVIVLEFLVEYAEIFTGASDLMDREGECIKGCCYSRVN